MKKIILFFVLALSISMANAQLFVKDAYVYVADKSIFVKEEINLNTANSFIYLRNDSQLLQGRTGTSNNVGPGAVSVYQEGTSNQYAYNYWCSPVGGSNATVGNSNFGITQLGVPTSSTARNAATILPYGNPDGTVPSAGNVNIAQRWIYTFVSSLNYSNWNFIGPDATIAPGLGFTMKGTSGTDDTYTAAIVAARTGGATNNPGNAQRYDFRGKPNDGNIEVPVEAGKLTLVGNPYPSALDMKLFVDDVLNSAVCEASVLYWQQPNTANSHNVASYQGGYQTYNASSYATTAPTLYAYDGAGTQLGSVGTGTAFDRRYAPVGQGFMIQGKAGIPPGSKVTFKNSHRLERKENDLAPNPPVFSRLSNIAQSIQSTQTYANYPHFPNVAGTDYTQISSAPSPHILINSLLNNTGIRQIALVFMPDALNGYDRADSRSADEDEGLPFDMYLSMDNKEYVHSAKPFAMNQTFQLGFKNNAAATFRLQVGQFVNFTATNMVYLHDKVTNQFYDIKNNYYEFTMPAGTNNTRYEITFQSNLSTADTSILNSLIVYHNIINKTIVVKNPKNISLKDCALYDISGKQIFMKNKLGSDSMYEFSTAGLSDAIYVVNVTSENNEVNAKKIAVSNSN